MTTGCDHKFVDSTSCIKCGWTPPLLNIVRVETEPPDYQADVIMGVGYFRMPSEEAMSDDLQASAAWQDVEQVLQQETGLHVLKILIADARAADAQQIAALRAENERLQLQIDLLNNELQEEGERD